MKHFPNLLIAGAAKAGTTSLYHYLAGHPEIYWSPVKEPCFLCYDQAPPRFSLHASITTDPLRYAALFARGYGMRYRGEATAIYLYHYRQTIASIKRYSDPADIKVIIVLRNPIDRAYSQYMMNVRDLRDPLDFSAALDAETERMKQGENSDFFYADRGFYADQVAAFQAAFPQLKILFYDDLKKDPAAIVRELETFLQLHTPVRLRRHEAFNVSGRSRYPWLIRAIRANSWPKRMLRACLPETWAQQGFERIKNRIYPHILQREAMHAEDRARLRQVYAEDIHRLEGLVGRDLSHWLTDSSK